MPYYKYFSYCAVSLWLILAFGLLTGCSTNNSATPTATAMSGNIIYTAAAQTVAAELTRLASGADATTTPIPPTSQGFTPAAAATNTPTPGSFTTCDRGGFVADISVPDGEFFSPEEPFTKVWRLKNTGSCTWTGQYRVVFDSGDLMGGPESFLLPNGDVLPGEEVDISVNLIAPKEPGNYRGEWKLANAGMERFGLGSRGTSSFWVDINVAYPLTFSVDFTEIHDCDGTPNAIFRISNQDNETFESAQVTLTDLDTKAVIYGPYAHNGPFMGGKSECPPGGDALRPSRTGHLGVSLENAFNDSSLQAVWVICTQDDLAGFCAEKSVNFNTP